MRSYKVALGMAAVSLFGGSLSACSGGGSVADLGKIADMARPADLAPATVKGVYTTSNDALDNQIYVYARAADGSLTAMNSYSTGGKGSGAGLGDQNGLIFDPAINMFFAVNNGDNTISMLSLKPNGSLELLYNGPSGGIKPVSITETGNVVYVVNAGNNSIDANISGFQVTGNGMTPLSGSSKNLSAKLPGPAQIQFNPSGTVLVVTEKMTNTISTYTVSAGIATGPLPQTSAGMTPFGFAFSANQKLIVSEAAAAAAGQGSTSSYTVATTGALTPISSKVASGQTAPCWVAVAANTAYVTNAQSNNITAYSVATDGTLGLLASGNSAMTGNGPTDEAVTEAKDYLYVLNSKDHSLSIFAISTTGALTKKQDFNGLPPNAVGLVAR